MDLILKELNNTYQRIEKASNMQRNKELDIIYYALGVYFEAIVKGAEIEVKIVDDRVEVAECDRYGNTLA